MATITIERHPRMQNFSSTFQGIKPRNTSLNTSITRSNIHPDLDPQFI